MAKGNHPRRGLQGDRDWRAEGGALLAPIKAAIDMPSAGPAFVAEIGPGPFYCGGRASSRARAFLHELLESYFDYMKLEVL